jgi:hypothetical protein
MCVSECVQVGSRSSRPPTVVLWLQGITLAWMLVECGLSLYAAALARSPALLAFGSDSLIELLSAMVVVLQVLPQFPYSQERANRTAGLLLFALAGIVVTAATCTGAALPSRDKSAWYLYHDCSAHRHAGFGLAQGTRGLSNQQSRAQSRCGTVG